MKDVRKTEGDPYDGIDLYDPDALLRAMAIDRASRPPTPPAPLADECATCHRKGTLRLTGSDGPRRREWLCERCGSVTTDGDLKRLINEYTRERVAMTCIPPTVRSLLVESAHALFQISRGDADALGHAGDTARRLIRVIERGGPPEDWFAEAE